MGTSRTYMGTHYGKDIEHNGKNMGGMREQHELHLRMTDLEKHPQLDPRGARAPVLVLQETWKNTRSFTP